MKENNFLKKIPAWPYTIWFGIAITAFIFLFIGINHESIWLDESFSAAIVRHNLGQIIHYTMDDVHPPLYYFILKLFRFIFGANTISLRVASLAGILAFIPLCAGPVKRLFGQKVALIFAILIIFAPISLAMAHEMRMYTWMSFFTLAGVVYGYSAVLSNKKKDWILFGLFTLAGAYTHYFSLLALFFTHLILFLFILIKARDRLKGYLITAGATLLLYLPWLIIFVRQTSYVAKGFWIPPVRWLEILQALVVPFSTKFDNLFPSIFSLIALLGSLGIIVFGIIRFMTSKKMKDSQSILLFFCVFMFTLTFVIIFSKLMVPILVLRYMTACTGVYLFTLVLGIRAFKKQAVQIGVFGLFLLLMLPVNISIFTQKYNGPAREVSEEIKTKLKPGDLILHGDIHTLGSIWYYLPQARHVLMVKSLSERGLADPEFYKADITNITDLSKVIGKEKNVWVVNRESGLITINPNTIIRAGYEKTDQIKEYDYPGSWFKISAVRLEYTGNMGKVDLFGDLMLRVGPLHNTKGNLLICLYKKGPINKENVYKYVWLPIKDVNMEFTFTDMDYDEYGVFVLHDENKNYIPDSIDATHREGMGCSVELSWDFDTVKFEFNKDTGPVEIRVQYD